MRLLGLLSEAPAFELVSSVSCLETSRDYILRAANSPKARQPRRRHPAPQTLIGTALIQQFLAALALLGATHPALATPLTYVGRVERVLDGDTISLKLANGRAIRVRLGEIDAPENHQPYGDEAKRQLMKLVGGRSVVARVNDVDRYGRAVARLDQGGIDVNARMVQRGAAWAYTRYQTDQRFAGWERQARRAKLGLWAGTVGKPIPPWDWRASKRAVVPVATTVQAVRMTRLASAAPAPMFICGKRLCRQMISCAEALHALHQCGVKRLDGDGDGKPCESLCS